MSEQQIRIELQGISRNFYATESTFFTPAPEDSKLNTGAKKYLHKMESQLEAINVLINQYKVELARINPKEEKQLRHKKATMAAKIEVPLSSLSELLERIYGYDSNTQTQL